MEKKSIAVLGATGSIGTQALEVIRAHPDRFTVYALTAGSNADLLIAQALEFRPSVVVIADPDKYKQVQTALAGTAINVLAGNEALEEVVQHTGVDTVLCALVGSVGLRSTLAAIEAGKTIALANKETLVVAGALVMDLAARKGARILPVDSEHSAIFQCLAGEQAQQVDKIYLTASGGPFRGKRRADLNAVTAEQALRHPNWVMGAKITIDSASLMNKGLEVIEAKWLFNLDVSQIDVVVHPQSIVHSLVQFKDGSIKAQLGLPDMKLPIQYALTYPDRVENAFPRFDFTDFSTLTFEPVDRVTFRNLELAYRALATAGNMPCILNAANEVVVAAFLKGETGFLAMSDVIEETLAAVTFMQQPTLADYESTDQQSRIIARELVTKSRKIYHIEK
ncbi:1-deoxy-D-xylulose-5-phosphate reductoisomerase [Parapedobacter lycopersici]|uniref:1-deoxy-D-xylulose-5-phosphate reductoisomerase n=1 Tax=Parapedobacter lycopersici TaxID=1864939 RepID=UPI00214DB997|nr:1-deoxy-D-xylulose-5-phosphate reductoisomerase [Parapedobacter lycopersici]